MSNDAPFDVGATRRVARTSAAMELAVQELRQGRPVRLRIATPSMAPLLRPGDEIEIAPAQPRQLRPGDIVALEAGGDVLVHRLLKLVAKPSPSMGEGTGEGDPRHPGPRMVLLTRGDAEAFLNRPSAASLLLGRVVAAQRGARRLHLTGARWRAAGRLYAALALVSSTLAARLPSARRGVPLRLPERSLLFALRTPERLLLLTAVWLARKP